MPIVILNDRGPPFKGIVFSEMQSMNIKREINSVSKLYLPLLIEAMDIRIPLLHPLVPIGSNENSAGT